MSAAISRSRRKRRGGNNSILCIIKPALIGLAAAVVVTLLFIMLFALIFVLMKSIVSSAILPLTLFAMTLGCLVGSYICARLSRERGFIYGFCIGLILFLAAYVLGMAMGQELFGTFMIIRLCCLLVSGCLGGWLGSNYAHTKRK